MVAFLGAVAVASPSHAGQDEGREIAERLCAECHAIGNVGASPLAEAPPFRSFATKWPLENIEEALAEGIVTGHEMPEFVFEPGEISDILAFLGTLTPRPD